MGRKKLPATERKVAIVVFVKKKYFHEIRAEIKELERKYNSIPNPTNADQSGVVGGENNTNELQRMA